MSARANSMSRGPCESRGSFSDEHGGRQKDRGKDGKEETTRLLLYPAAVSTRETGAVSPLIFFFKVNLIPPDGRQGLLPLFAFFFKHLTSPT